MFLDSKIPPGQFNKFKSFEKVMSPERPKAGKKYMILFSIFAFTLLLFLPWTQTIQSVGQVSTLNPRERPQQINSVIAGRVAQWNVKDGDIVKKGDTLVRITEIKEEYLDPSQIIRVGEQISAKDATIGFYINKASAEGSQSVALSNSRKLKLNQLKNKIKQYSLLVQSDSISFIAAKNHLSISLQQLDRQRQLYDAGLKSLTEFEQRQQAYQDALARKISSENKFYNSRNELLNVMIEQSAIEQDYVEKILKADGSRFSTLSDIASTRSEVAKLKNQISNYRLRRDFYVITAPQSGQVIKTSKAGIGETLKAGDPLLEIVPLNFEIAVEIFVEPVDLPLVNRGQKVRLQFDGFPAIVFSGWPDSSYGTFGGEITAVDPSISTNGKFRVWVIPDPKDKPWPAEIKYGSGAKGIALLNDVPIIYELWRQLNGFPPEYYTLTAKLEKENEK